MSEFCVNCNRMAHELEDARRDLAAVSGELARVQRDFLGHQAYWHAGVVRCPGELQAEVAQLKEDNAAMLPVVRTAMLVNKAQEQWMDDDESEVRVGDACEALDDAVRALSPEQRRKFGGE